MTHIYKTNGSSLEIMTLMPSYSMACEYVTRHAQFHMASDIFHGIQTRHLYTSQFEKSIASRE